MTRSKQILSDAQVETWERERKNEDGKALVDFFVYSESPWFYFLAAQLAYRGVLSDE